MDMLWYATKVGYLEKDKLYGYVGIYVEFQWCGKWPVIVP